MVCLGFEPRTTGWKAQTNLLSYGGVTLKGSVFENNISPIHAILPTTIGERTFCDWVNLQSLIWTLFNHHLGLWKAPHLRNALESSILSGSPVGRSKSCKWQLQPERPKLFFCFREIASTMKTAFFFFFAGSLNLKDGRQVDVVQLVERPIQHQRSVVRIQALAKNIYYQLY